MPYKDKEKQLRAVKIAVAKHRKGITLKDKARSDVSLHGITYGQDADGRLTKTMGGFTYRLPKDWGTWSVFESAMAACNYANTHFIPLKRMSPAERHQRFAYDMDGKPSGKELDSLPEIRADVG